MSTSVLKALPGKLDIKDTHLVFSISRQASRCQQAFSKPCLVHCKLDIKRYLSSILYISASLAMSTSVLKALPGKLDIKDTHLVFSISRQASRCQQALLKPCLVNLTSKDTHLVFSISRQASRCQQAFSKPCLVNLTSKDTHLVFSMYTSSETLRDHILQKHCHPCKIYVDNHLKLGTYRACANAFFRRPS